MKKEYVEPAIEDLGSLHEQTQGLLGDLLGGILGGGGHS
jgi:hypothetical protein